ncbi:MAG: hypothetical protein ACXWC2_11225 [Ramlibacter sp.]
MVTRKALRAWMGVGMAAAGLGLASAPAAAQLADAAAPDGRPPASRLGLDPDKVQFSIGCGSSLLPCRNQAQAQAASSLPDSLRWSVELGAPTPGTMAGRGLGPARQGLNLSLVGRKPLFGSSFSVYGKLGTTYGYADPALAAATGTATDSGYGLSFGAGLSMNFTPRLSASFGFDAQDMHLGTGAPRDPVRATSLGLQYRY